MIDTLKKSLKGLTSTISDTNQNDEKINNIFDYSNAVPTKEAVSHLVKYCDSIYEQYLWLLKEDEKKEIKSYQQKYNLFLDIRIKDQKFNIIVCNSYMAFKKACLDGNLDNIDSMEIRLNISYKKDVIYNNLFTILIKPFNLKFIRQSNCKQLEMDILEQNINEILKRFHTVNSLFCTK